MNKQKNNLGFTLIEMLIVMAMIAIVAASTFQVLNFSANGKSLILAINEAKSLVRKAQSYSLSMPVVETGKEKICGFGIKLGGSSDELQIFYSYNDNFAIDPNACQTADYRKYSLLHSKIVEIYRLPAGHSFSSAPSIFFSSPYGEIYDATGINKLATPVVYTIKLLARNKSFSVNQVGNIYNN